MQELSPKVRAYILLLLASMLVLAAVSAWSLRATPMIYGQAVFFVLVVFVTDLYPIVLPYKGDAEITISCAFKTAAIIIFGMHIGILIALVGTLMAEIKLGRAWYKAAFNTAEMTLTFAAMGAVYQVLYDGTAMPFHSLRNALAMACVILTYFLVNTGLVTMVVSLSTGANFSYIWKTNFRDVSWANLTIIPLGAVVATLWLYRPWSILALVLPMVAVRQSYQFIADLQRQTREALINMADAIDHRDPSTYEHSQRVATLAGAIAKEMGLPAEDTDIIRMAARLHDLGKIGMSNTLLYKPGKFDAGEVAEFRQHSAIGADIVKSFRLFSDGQSLIRHHHERYNGSGYPDGLAGEEIPLGSRVLAVADSFDAMTSWRIYRPSLSLSEALEELTRNKGTQFDPEVVEAFVRVVDQWEGRLPWPIAQMPPLTAAKSVPGLSRRPQLTTVDPSL